MTNKVIQLQVKPGIQRDGTHFAASSYTDGEWVRFQSGLPRKIGGYNGIFLNASGISRGMTMTSENGINYVVSGYSLGIEQWYTDNEDGIGFGPVPYVMTGGVVAVQIVNNGNGTYTNGTYTTVPLTGGTGSSAQATVVVSGGSIVSVAITIAGTGYTVGDLLSATAASIGGTGTGFSLLLTANTIFTGGSNTLWQFDIGYDTSGGSTSNLVAHPGQNLNAIDSTVNTRPLTGVFPGTSLSPVGVFTGNASTTSGSAVITLESADARVGAGQTITGAGIPAGATVVSAAGDEITMSVDATATTSTTLSGVYVTSTTGQFTCTATTGLAVDQIVNISGTTTSSFLNSVYTNDTNGTFTYAGGTPLTIGQPILVSGTSINSNLTSFYATSTAGTFSCVSPTVLTVGQQVSIAGTTSNTTLSGVSAVTTSGIFRCNDPGFDLQVGQPIVLSGTGTNVTINNPFAINTTGTFTCAPTSSQLSVGQSVTITGTAANTTLGTVTAVNSSGTFSCAAVSSSLFVGQQVAVSGTGLGFPLSGVSITGTAGQFACTASSVPLSVGQSIRISGTFTGPGSITGYTDPTTYFIIATNGSTTFQLSTTAGGAPVTTTAGGTGSVVYTLNNIAGYSNPTTYFITATNGATIFTLSATANGPPVSTAVGIDSGLVFNAVATSITGYTNPTTYFIIETNGFTIFKLSATLNGSAITTTVGGTANLVFTGLPLSVTGYTNPTTYFIIATDKRNVFQLSTTAGGTAVTTTIGPSTGFTFVANALSITGYTNPTTYFIIATDGGTTFTLSNTFNGAAIATTVGFGNGLTVTARSATITGYVNPTTYYVIETNGTSTFQLSATLGGPPVVNTIGFALGLSFAVNPPARLNTVAITGAAGQFSCATAEVRLVVGQPVLVSGVLTGSGSITGYLNPTLYYIRVTNGTTTFSLSASLGGAAITTTAGTTTGLSFILSPIGIPGYPLLSSYYIIATNGTTTLQLSASLGGSPITTVVGSTKNLTFSVSKPVAVTFDNNISVSGGVVVLHPYLFVYGNNGLIQNCSASDFNNWVAPDANANNVSTGKVIKGLPLRGGTTSPAGLFWSLDSLIRVTYAPSTVNGVNFYWRYDLLSSQTSVLSSQCMIEYDGMFYWAAVDRFLSYNGVVQEMPNNSNQNYFFDNLNYAQRQKVWCTKVPRWGEIWWFYPRGDATECTDAIIYNVREKVWYDAGEAPGARRSAGTYSEVFRRPIWGGNEVNTTGKYTLWQHETGTNEVYTTQVNAIRSSFETNNLGWVTGGPGNPQLAGDNRWLRLERVEPDFVQVGDMNLYVTGQGYADDADQVSAPYVFNKSTLKIDMREQRRLLRLKFESNTFNGDYYMGKVLLSADLGDERSTGNP